MLVNRIFISREGVAFEIAQAEKRKNSLKNVGVHRILKQLKKCVCHIKVTKSSLTYL
jgi:hypothetical protein